MNARSQTITGWSLRKKMLVSFGSILTAVLLTVVIIGIAFMQVRQAGKSAANVSIPAAFSASRLQFETQHLHQLLVQAAAEFSKDEFAEADAVVNKVRLQLAQFKTQYEANHDIANAKKIEKLDGDVVRLLKDGKQMAEIYMSQGGIDAAGPQLKTFTQAAKALASEIEALSSHNLQAGKTAMADIVKTSNTGLTLVIALAVVMVAVALGIAFTLSRSIMRMLGGEPAYAAHIANQIAEGQLDIEVREDAHHHGSVIAAMKSMQMALKQRLAAERKAADENMRIRIALDKASTCMMLADKQGTIVYCNQTASNLFTAAATEISKRVSKFSSAALIGINFDDLYQQLSSNAQPLVTIQSTHTTQILLGENIWHLTLSPVVNSNGERIGTTLEWLDRSMEAHAEEELGNVLSAAVAGDFSKQLSTDNKQGFFHNMADSMNTLLQVVSSGLADVGRVLDAIAKGNLTERITTSYQGVFARLKEHTNTTVERLSEVLQRIQDSTRQINTAAEEIAAGNMDLSSRTEAQAGSLEQTASSMEELSKTVNLNAANAEQANELAYQSNTIASKGGAMVKRVVETMSTIQTSSRKIADIIGVIDSIAFQTNILALNAAVEAARAGEQGRGFAVVASEVRNLAQRSAQAAKEIKELIADSVNRVNNGAELVEEAGRTMEDVVISFEKVAALVTNITSASKDQSAGIASVATAVSKMDEVTQQNSALVEEAAATAENLREQAQILENAVAMFVL